MFEHHILLLHSTILLYHIWYQDWVSLHSTASKHWYIYHLLHFSWPAHIDRAYSKVFNIDAHTQKMKKLQEKIFECKFSDFCMLNAWSLYNNYIQDYLFRRAKESVKRWLISLTLKNIKSCFDDDFWVHTNMFLKHVMSQTQNSCQNKLSKFEFHSLIIVSSQKSHKSYKLSSMRWSYVII